MARPSPTILEAKTDNTTGKLTEVMKSQGVYFVTRRGVPIGMRVTNKFHESQAKYGKTSFTSPGHAYNLAEKLNKLYSTNLFEVHRVTSSQVVVESFEDDDE